jgi:hypothetical protein
MRNSHKMSVGTPQGKRTLDTWDDNIKTDFKGCMMVYAGVT